MPPASGFCLVQCPQKKMHLVDDTSSRSIPGPRLICSNPGHSNDAHSKEQLSNLSILGDDVRQCCQSEHALALISCTSNSPISQSKVFSGLVWNADAWS